MQKYVIEACQHHSISENNESLLSNCRAKKMSVIVNKQVRILTTQYIGTCRSAYTKGYAIFEN